MWLAFRFILGLALGSFLNVLSLRYNPDKFLFRNQVIGGRSRCPHCRRTLRWFELIPLLSFALQLGRCRTCRAHLTWQYPLVELLSGLIFVFVPLRLASFSSLLPPPSSFLTPHIPHSTFHILVFLILLLITLIDLRWRIIPDELNVLLAVLGLAILYLPGYPFGPVSGSFLGHYALLFGFRETLLWNRVAALAAVALLFGGLILVTRGRGMGLGDLKLVLPLALVFGWPDVLIISLLAFVLGTLASLPAIFRSRRALKMHVPFGPLLFAATLAVFFFGTELIRGYFQLFGL
ncbi:MAG: prepilin peptidase [Candidatus Liptonbacteria bacterium]|nr:prepilin peptidase [Candidatus Liptonbacteria bacterium]